MRRIISGFQNASRSEKTNKTGKVYLPLVLSKTTMKKIEITKIAKKVLSFRGLGHKGCYGADCDDECCKYGADIDKESYDLIFKNRKSVEKAIEAKLEDCFKDAWYDEEDFLGGNGTETKVGKSGFCMFHNPKGKGCVLYELVNVNKLPRRIIPSICRLYPLTWRGGELTVAGDIYDSCDCKLSQKNILETQKKEIEDIFEIRSEIKKKYL